ncbi:MAG: hypothetical protein KC476_07065 [Cyanobacteria bacterium HKST-UBA06]|nr:hypothetical protein [Cyanobacteria bacterium HKST-UBA05]MCA9798051.1 hypothetical protein [Cyanobacteria bacterium HKST-UBA04]MCA9807700.1 hypothetical protein [Cyanobacteria bacterium HKST-UBA06]
MGKVNPFISQQPAHHHVASQAAVPLVKPQINKPTKHSHNPFENLSASSHSSLGSDSYFVPVFANGGSSSFLA